MTPEQKAREYAKRICPSPLPTATSDVSALPPEFQDHIIGRYKAEGVPLLDANSGFEPRTFTEEVFRRWQPIIDENSAPWRFGYDDRDDAPCRPLN